jgi:hypothetical protein
MNTTYSTQVSISKRKCRYHKCNILWYITSRLASIRRASEIFNVLKRLVLVRAFFLSSSARAQRFQSCLAYGAGGLHSMYKNLYFYEYGQAYNGEIKSLCIY